MQIATGEAVGWSDSFTMILSFPFFSSFGERQDREGVEGLHIERRRVSFERLSRAFTVRFPAGR